MFLSSSPIFFFFKQKTAYEMRISDWSSDVCSSDLVEGDSARTGKALRKDAEAGKATFVSLLGIDRARQQAQMLIDQAIGHLHGFGQEADLLRAVARFAIERDR